MEKALVFVAHVAAKGRRSAGDECADHQRKCCEDREGGRGFASGIGRLPSFGFRLFGARDRIVHTLLRIGLRNAGLGCHKLREVGPIGWRDVAISNAVGKDAASLCSDLLIAGRRIDVIGAEKSID